ncbi:serine-rich adhesin for platelets [Malaya genurostris]|uniref:serine-rich adhesin for platelets n=1 Tax=Malaya genurostris TaxID=325434 RepID=UPI0026F3A776|nr:serine-rich adhesin for platelets [Malaya genurostris]
MPRIDPLKLLVCLSVLLAPNGGIRSSNEVKRLANLMAKFSKKLVSKCIYIQILKCTETELLGQFMAAGGWSLVHMWLADGITTKNWPLIQELLELLLCCPVDVERLKSNTAPKLVKSLSKDSSHEGVRLLASKLVEQWLKIARNDIRSGSQTSVSQPQSDNASSSAGVDAKSDLHKNMAGDDDNVVDESLVDDEDTPSQTTSAELLQQNDIDGSVAGDAEYDNENVEETKKAFNTAVAESNAKKAPLLFKITMKNGKQVLAKVESPIKKGGLPEATVGDDEMTDTDNAATETDSKEQVNEVDVSEEKTSKETNSVSTLEDGKVNVERSESDKKDRRKSDEKERSREKDKSSKDKEKHKEKDKDKDKKSSSSGSSHRSSKSSSSSSSSKHNSSSSSSKSKSSSSSGSKSSSSSSSSRDKDKDRHNSSSSSNSSSKHHHKSSSSSSKSSSSSSKSGSSSDKHRDNKDKSNHSSKDKDKDGQPKVSSPSAVKLPKIPRRIKDEDDENLDAVGRKMSPVNTKKASISIEVRNAENRPKTVKTYNSQFRSHGLIEEAPPPPSRKGLKKPASASSPSTVIGSTATGTIPNKRSSPPPTTKDAPPEKKSRDDPTERPGAIKLIPPKRQHSLVESDMFMDALSATLKKDVKKRKRRHSGSEGSAKPPTEKAAAVSTTTEKSSNKAASPEKTVPPLPTSPTVEKSASPTKTKQPDATVPETNGTNESEPVSPAKVIAAPMSFYRDTLADTEETGEEKKVSEEQDEKTAEKSSEDVETKKEEPLDTPAEPEDDDDDIVKKPKRLKSELNDDVDIDEKSLIDAVDDDLEKRIAQAGETQNAQNAVKKPPGPGCGPDGPPGVLVIHRRKGPKKQLKWRAQEDLEEIRYFELDVTERCNVTKTFSDLKNMERVDERENYILSRKIHSDDNMTERIPWLPLITVDNVPSHPEGVNSQEKRIQRDRERNVLQALYFNRHMIPDSPAEPDVEVYSISQPAHIPMDDVTGNPDSVNDFTTMPWPEPKSTPPHESAGFNSPFFPGTGNDFSQFGVSGNWDLPGTNPPPIQGMFQPNRMPPQGMPTGGPNNSPHNGPGGPNMMRQMSIPPNLPPNIASPVPHPNMFQNNFGRGPMPMQHMNDLDDDNFRNGPPPPPAWFNNGNNNNRGHPSSHQGNFHHNRGGFGGRGGGGNWNRDNDRGGPRSSNYRPPWLQNRGNHNNHRGGRKW